MGPWSLLFLSGLAADLPPRRVTDLSGVWEIRADPDDAGLAGGWFKLDRADEPAEWRPIVVPSSFETVLGTRYDGVAWYRRAVPIPADAAGRTLLLRFHGAATLATVWLNGEELGGHAGAWTPFTFDVTGRVQPGETASLVVRVDERVGYNTQGFLPIIAPHFGGLWQGVELIDLAVGVTDTAVDRGQPADRHTVTTDGETLLVDGRPTIIRGVLNWGYNPPRLDPNLEVEAFGDEVRYLKACGFNLIKFCLWVPPTPILQVCDDEDMLVWMEYPTWHPTLDRAHQPELLREYGEFLRHDRGHRSVVLRSITCETGPSADLDVLRSLYDLCHELAPGGLVVDDSSWIGWNRIHDFWDDHSYGNNRWWRGQLAGLQAHIDQHGAKPLLLGEAIAADTWPDTRWLQGRTVDGRPWWAPKWLDRQLEFEAELQRRWAAPGYDPVADLREWSLDYALIMRRWQIETYREAMPQAGYVVSVVRDFTTAAMGLYGYDGRPKWRVDDWAWHGEHTTSTPTPGDQRGYRAAAPPAWAEAVRSVAVPELPPVPEGTVLHGDPAERELTTLFPGAASLPAEAAIPAGTALVVTASLSRPVLDYLEAGGRVLHLTSGQRGSWRDEGTWWLRGTVWTPPTPAAFFERVPGDLLRYLQLFELGGNSVIRGEALARQVDPLVMFIETHDLDRVRPNLLLFETGVGDGRLAVSCLRHEGGEADNYAGVWLARELARYLLDGPAPTRRLDDEVRDALRTALDAQVQKIATPWRFSLDPEASGQAQRFEATDFDDSGWRELTARTPEEGAIWNAYDGWGWYRQRVTIPADWAGRRVRLVFDSVDDMYELYVNGRLVGGYGRMDRSESSFLKRTSQEVSAFVEPGRENLFVVRVYDWVGSGGLNGEVWLTTGPVDEGLDFLRR